MQRNKQILNLANASIKEIIFVTKGGNYTLGVKLPPELSLFMISSFIFVKIL